MPEAVDLNLTWTQTRLSCFVCNISLWFLTSFYVHQVPVIIPILVVLASIYLIVAPFYEAPIESFCCLLFILAGIPFYLVFVHFKIVPQSFFDGIGKFGFCFSLLNLLTPKSAEYLLTIEGFSTECRKTQTKSINMANHKGHGQYNEPIWTRSKYT